MCYSKYFFGAISHMFLSKARNWRKSAHKMVSKAHWLIGFGFQGTAYQIPVEEKISLFCFWVAISWLRFTFKSIHDHKSCYLYDTIYMVTITAIVIRYQCTYKGTQEPVGIHTWQAPKSWSRYTTCVKIFRYNNFSLFKKPSLTGIWTHGCLNIFYQVPTLPSELSRYSNTGNYYYHGQI